MEYGFGKRRKRAYSNFPPTYRGIKCDIPLAPLVVVSCPAKLSFEFQSSRYVNWGQIGVAIAYIYIYCYQARVAKPQDITFLSPYNQQCQVMSWKCSRELLDIPIEVKTGAVYQGEENDIVLFSSIRSYGDGVGLGGDQNMMTTALTRAKQSLVLIGDHEHLGLNSPEDGIWRRLNTALRDMKVEEVEVGSLYMESGELFNEAKGTLLEESAKHNSL